MTKSTPFGSVDHPFNPIAVALGAEASFVARTIDNDRAHLTEVLRKAAAHRGTAFVEIYQNCNVFNDGASICCARSPRAAPPDPPGRRGADRLRRGHEVRDRGRQRAPAGAAHGRGGSRSDRGTRRAGDPRCRSGSRTSRWGHTRPRASGCSVSSIAPSTERRCTPSCRAPGNGSGTGDSATLLERRRHLDRVGLDGSGGRNLWAINALSVRRVTSRSCAATPGSTSRNAVDVGRGAPGRAPPGSCSPREPVRSSTGEGIAWLPEQSEPGGA